MCLKQINIINQRNNLIYNDYVSPWCISRAICHMKSTKYIDQKCIYLTIHLKDDKDFEKATYSIHEFLKSLFDKKNLPLRKVPGIISSLDYEGSKFGRVSNRSPHIHAVIYLAKQDTVGVIDMLESFLKGHDLISNSTKNPIKITIFENWFGMSLNDQSINIINYNRKARMDDDYYRKNLVLPYDDIIVDQSKKLTIDRLVIKQHKIYNDLTKNLGLQNYYSKGH